MPYYQENNYSSKNCPFILAVRIFVNLKTRYKTLDSYTKKKTKDNYIKEAILAHKQSRVDLFIKRHKSR